MGISDKMIISGDDLLAIIPQRPPMVMIDKLYISNNEASATTLLIREDNIFCENNRFSESGLIENIAQTAAAGFGYNCWRDNKKVPLGYIGAIQKLKIYDLPSINEEITTKITDDYKVINFSVITGKSYLNDKLLAECEMKILLNQREE